MCGIAGIWNLDGEPVDDRTLDRLTDTMSHRGPDGRGTWKDSATPLGLGHRRLAILDLTPAGLQPLVSHCQRYSLVFNGEIYNFVELRKELETKGHTFRTDTDTEVLLTAYVEWGKECQEKLNGMWAFAIWDRQERELFLSRDRFSIKPLHYYYDGKHFAFASELRPFLTLPFVGGGLDPVGYRFAFERASHAAWAQDTILAGVRQVPGGWCLRVQKGKTPQIKRWWNTLDHLEEPPATFEDQVEKFRELFADSCRLRMRSDTPIGTALSGGVDSGSVYSMLADIASNGHKANERIQADWRRAFVAAYRNTKNDEEKAALDLVDHVSGNGSSIPISPPENLDEFDRITADAEAICWDIPIGPWKVYQAMRDNGVYVSMDGHGGDETLAGYVHFITPALHDALLPCPKPKALYDLYRLQKTMDPRRYGFKVPGIRDVLWPENRTYTASLFNEFHRDKARWKGDALGLWLFEETHYTGLATNLRDFDRLSMAHGVEVRTPFLDWRLVCFAFSLPGTSKLGGGYTKRILREAMHGLLPDFIRTEKIKRGFGSPMEDWKKQSVKNYIHDAVNDYSFLDCPLFNGREMQRTVNKLAKSSPQDVPNLDRQIMAARVIGAMKKSVAT